MYTIIHPHEVLLVTKTYCFDVLFPQQVRIEEPKLDHSQPYFTRNARPLSRPLPGSL